MGQDTGFICCFHLAWNEKPFQTYWVPVNSSPQDESNKTKTKASCLVARTHKTSNATAINFNFMQETRENWRVKWQQKVFLATILYEERGKPGQPERQLLQQKVFQLQRPFIVISSAEGWPFPPTLIKNKKSSFHLSFNTSDSESLSNELFWTHFDFRVKC